MKKYLGLALVLCLSACGFHLKGSVPLGDALHYQVWAVDGGTMQTALENALRRQSNVRLDATNPEVLVKVLDVRQQKDVSAINIGGNTIEYMLNLRVDAQAWWKRGLRCDRGRTLLSSSRGSELPPKIQ